LASKIHYRSSIAVSPGDFDLAVEGLKHCTIRRGIVAIDHPRLTMTSRGCQVQIEVVRVEAGLKFGDLTSDHARAEGLLSLDDLRKDLWQYYPDLRDDEPVTAIWFNVSGEISRA
jgi:hypothetical protein